MTVTYTKNGVTTTVKSSAQVPIGGTVTNWHASSSSSGGSSPAPAPTPTQVSNSGGSSVINIDSNPSQILAPGQVYTYQGQTYTQPGGSSTPTIGSSPSLSTPINIDSNPGQILNPGQTYTYQGQTYTQQGTPTPPSNILSTDTLANNPKADIPTYVPSDQYDPTAILNAMKAGQITNAEALKEINVGAGVQSNTDFQTMLSNLVAPPSTEAIYNTALDQSGKIAAQQKVNDLSGQLNSIITAGQVAQQTLESNSGGKGVTSQFLGKQQQEVSRIAAIQALPVSAALNIAQGNLQMATENLNTLFSIKSADAQAQYEYKNNLVKSVYDFATSQEKIKLDGVMAIYNQQYQTQLNNTKSIQDIAITAATTGRASAATITAISNATTINGAIIAAGSSLQTSSNEIIDVGGNKMLVDKLTGKVIKSYGGATPTDSSTSIPIIRTVTTPDGKKTPVDGYTLIAGDDPYFIAQKFGTDMQDLKDLNPNIKDWNNLQVGAVINVPNKTNGSGSILAATGLSMPAFMFLTQGTTALTRMTAAQRLQYMNEAQNYVNKTGTDVATFKSQYSALGNTVEANVLRNNQAAVTENELVGTIANIKQAATEANLTKLSGLNIAKIWGGQQLSDANATTFKFHLEQIRKEYATYNAVLGGGIDQNGNVRELNPADYKAADDVIQSGFAAGSIDGFESALKRSMDKMRGVLENSINAQNQQVWKLFGVGDQYQAKTTPVDPMVKINTVDTSNPGLIDQIYAAMPNATVEEIANYLISKGF